MPELVYDVKFRIDPASARSVTQMAGGGTSGTASEGTQISRTTGLVNALGEAYEDVGNSAVKSSNQSKRALKGVGNQAALTSRQMNQLVDAQNKTGRAAARTSKNFSVANQTLFSFSDGIQDAAQFSQGFGVGMRAIGNNIGFTIELMTSLNNRVKEHNALVKAGAIQNGKYMTTFGALTSALRGPGGVLLAVNAAITAITVLTTRTKKASDSTSEFVDVLKGYSSFITGADGVTDPFGIRARRFDLLVFESQLNRIQGSIEGVLDASAQSAAAINPLVGGLGALFSQFEKTEGIAEKLLNVIGATPEEFVAASQAAKELSVEIEKTRLTQKAYTDFLNMEGNEGLRDFVALTDRLSVAVGFDKANAFLKDHDILIAFNNQQQTATALGGELLMMIDDQKNKVRALTNEKGFYNETTKEVNQDVLREINLLNQMIALYQQLGLEVDETSNKLDEFKGNFLQYSGALGQLVSAISSLSSARTAENEKQARKQFETQKKLAYASAVIAGSEAVVKALPNPFLVALATATTAIQLAAIRRQQFSYSGDVPEASSGGGGGFGLRETEVSRRSAMQSPSFMPVNGNMGGNSKVDVQIMADRKQLYYIVKRGEEEYNEVLS